MSRLLIFGLGYSGTAIARNAAAAGFSVTATSRSGTPGTIPFEAADTAIVEATHLLTTAGPQDGVDPVLARYRDRIEAAPALRWIGYLSTTAVYGNRDGGWITEDTPPAPTQTRGVIRATIEAEWAAFADRHAVDLFRLAGIYGAGRSALDDIKAGRARRIIKPGHAFGRIHRDDIARAVVAAMRQDAPPGRRVFNLSDDEPAEPARVVEEAAALLGVPPATAFPFAEIEAGMSPMARSFWMENRKVANAKTKATLGISWLYPTYREGLRAILAEHAEQGRS
jgi:nucleoside-diphosphate-sugar epimerase